jgi:hypothetical protein
MLLGQSVRRFRTKCLKFRTKCPPQILETIVSIEDVHLLNSFQRSLGISSCLCFKLLHQNRTNGVHD